MANAQHLLSSLVAEFQLMQTDVLWLIPFATPSTPSIGYLYHGWSCSR